MNTILNLFWKKNEPTLFWIVNKFLFRNWWNPVVNSSKYAATQERLIYKFKIYDLEVKTNFRFLV